MFPIMAGNSASTGYNLTRSLRFRASASAYLNRTFTSTGNRQIWTWSGWVKRGSLSNGTLFGADGATYAFIYFNNDSLDCGEVVVTQQWRRITTQVFRDPSAWYHIVFAFDSTQATAGNRIKLYVNGAQVTAFSTSADPSLNYNSVVNTTIAHSIGSFAAPTRQAYLDGYLTEVNFIDGQALTPSSFGSTNALTGVWQYAPYTGTYGTNGFHLEFKDNSALTTSSNVGLGKDTSGNGNYWTTNNISITAGVTYDSMTDVPTLTSATAANFAVLNPVALGIDATLTNGNLNIAYGSAATRTGTSASIGMTSGKYYWEATVTASSASPCNLNIGISNTTENSSVSSGIGYYPGYTANGWSYSGADGLKYNNLTGVAYGATFTTGDVIGVAFDATAGSLTFYKNNTSQGVAYSSLPAGTYYPALGDGGGAATFSAAFNFGQQPFQYTPPTGFVALNTFNLPTSTILQGNKVMDATLYTGNGGTQAVTNAGGFKPDLVWLKSRSAAYDHLLFDSIRGTGKALFSSSTAAETTTNNMSAFNSNGFTALYDATYIGSNNSGVTMVGWQWQAGQGSTSSNTSGTITSTVSVNASAGFSVVTWTYNSSGGTIGHGLGVAPQLIIQKDRTNGTYSWDVYHASLGATQRLSLNNTNATQSQIVWNNTAPTSSVFSSGASWYTNGDTMVSYCWTPIAGYSAFGSYTGNGSTDGPFVYTGFRPRFVMIKLTSASGTNWEIWDSVRNPYNITDLLLLPSSSNAESTYSGNYPLDLLSNGFKIRGSGSGLNDSGGSFIYMAFAENPFRNSLAR